MNENKSRKREDYEGDYSGYDWRVDNIWRDTGQLDDLDKHYNNSINFFCKRTSHEKQQYTSTEFIVPEVSYDRLYDVQLVIRLVKDIMMLQRLTRCPDGIKRRITPTKAFLAMESYDEVVWIGLLEEIRFAVRNNINEVLLSSKEIAMISPDDKPTNKRKK